MAFRASVSSAILIASFVFGPLHANAEIAASQKVEKEIVVIDDKGEKSIKRVVADAVAPGEEVIYTLSYTNTASAPAENVMLVMPVPKEMVFMEGSAEGEGAALAFSTDGGESFLARGRLTVQQDGVVRPARSEDITHIRWTLREVGAKEANTVSFRGVLK